MNYFKLWLRQLLFRGQFLKFWLKRVSAILDREYSRVVASHFHSQVASAVPTASGYNGTSVRRILFVCANMWEERELLPELQKLSEVTFLDLLPCLTSVGGHELFRVEEFERLWNDQVRGIYDVGIVYLDARRLNQQILHRVRAATVGPVIGMNLDDKTTYAEYSVFKQSPQAYRNWASCFDCNLTNSRAHVDIYRDDGFSSLYLPTGFHYNPQSQEFRPAEIFDFPISFVGSCKPEREEFVEKLRLSGVPVVVFGGGWPNGQFTDDGPRVYRTSQINLGIGYNLPGDQFTNLKNRDFECPGSGGCYLTTFDWELAGLLEVGKEILCYRSLSDFMEIYLYYSRRPNECQAIARAGFERCRNEHTWAHRFQNVFSALGLKSTINLTSRR